MSKMSQLHAELTEEAYENGFETLEEYLADQERTKAHEAWLKEKEEVIDGLEHLLNLWAGEYTNFELAYVLGKSQEVIGKAIDFIKKGEQ